MRPFTSLLQSPAARAVIASGAIYAAAITVMGTSVLALLSDGIANDVGDPVLNAAILAWNAIQVPWTDAWFDFPGFHPARDGMTFTEHLLGVSVIATPIYWLTGSAAVTYNLTTLLLYVLCGLAMYALVWRLTGHAGASFLAGLAYAFAPYRASQVAHIQVLAVPWAPLALLGLHAYLETGRRRWLALFGASWVLQGAANGYFLVFFSVVVGLWGLWFVVAQRRWRALAAITFAGVVALLPLVPILARFVSAHDRYMLERSPEEILTLSADASAILCAPPDVAVWDWLQYGTCGGERELFPGVAVLALCVIGAWFGRPRAVAAVSRSGLARAASVLSAALFVVGLLLIASAISVALAGPWQWSVGPIEISSSSVLKPFTRGMLALLLALICAPSFRRALATASVPAFYALCAVVTWMCAWGPAPRLFGRPALEAGPYALLMLVPGVDGLRVPARFWMMTVLCLAVLAGLLLARLFRRFGPQMTTAIVVVGACALFVDGWAPLRAAGLVLPPPAPEMLRGSTVLTLPLGGNIDLDAAAQYEAVSGGWRSVNGYSGYAPRHYYLLAAASNSHDPVIMAPFLARGELQVVVHERYDGHVLLAESMPGARLVATGNGQRQYRIPQQGTLPPAEPGGQRLEVRSVTTSCSPDKMPFATDGNYTTRWECGPQRPEQAMTVDLGEVVTTGAVVPALGVFYTDWARHLRVETSVDGEIWETAWDRTVLLETIEAELRDSRTVRIVLPFAPRPARYVRLRLMSSDDVWYWSIAELEVWTGTTNHEPRNPEPPN